MAKYEEIKSGVIFDAGQSDHMMKDFFIGNSFMNSLVKDDNVNVTVANVVFEAGSRNNWHKHNNGYQILLVTGGEGWFQEDGKAAQTLKEGDVVVTHDGVKHWHGAKEDSWFSHIAITAGEFEWLEAVDDTSYQALNYGLI